MTGLSFSLAPPWLQLGEHSSVFTGRFSAKANLQLNELSPQLIQCTRAFVLIHCLFLCFSLWEWWDKRWERKSESFKKKSKQTEQNAKEMGEGRKGKKRMIRNSESGFEMFSLTGSVIFRKKTCFTFIDGCHFLAFLSLLHKHVDMNIFCSCNILKQQFDSL